MPDNEPYVDPPDPLDWRVPYPHGLPPSTPARPSPNPKDSTMPSAVWLCPVHAEEFWVPHGGVCPAPGCTVELVRYQRTTDV
jgi:hypothetical protein